MTQAPPEPLTLDLSATDIIKLQAVTLLPICEALERAGIVTSREVGAMIASRVPPHDKSSWALVASAMAHALLSGINDPVSEPARSDPQPRPRLTLIRGGLETRR